MQGWRVRMEDAHSTLPSLDPDTAFFAVYDGHGGQEVALYCREKLPEKLKSDPEFTAGKVGEALKKIFLELDDDVRGSAAASEMKELLRKETAGDTPEGSSEDEEYIPTAEEELMLKQEAEIPLDDIIAQFGPISNGDGRKTIFQAIMEQELDATSSEGSEEGLNQSGSDSGISEYDSPSSSPSPTEEVTKSPSQPSDGITQNSTSSLSNLKPSCELLALDASSNLEVPTLQNPSLPSPIQSPDKLPHSDLSDNPELEETEATLKRELEEADKTPLLLQPDSSDEEQTAESEEEKKSRYKLTRDVKNEGFDSGTTAVVCVVHKGEIVVANVGDSRCVLSRQGEAYPLSFDHKPGDEGELKRINKAGGTVGPDGRVNAGLNLSRAIGDHIYKRNKKFPLEEQMISAMPDINSTTLQPGDNFILLACDGIFNVMDNQEAITFVQNRLDKVDLSKDGPPALARICEELCDGCLADDTHNDGSGCDNMTAIIVVPETIASPSLASSASRKRKSSGSGDAPKRLKSGSLDTC